jgi:hypothetical protein
VGWIPRWRFSAARPGWTARLKVTVTLRPMRHLCPHGRQTGTARTCGAART